MITPKMKEKIRDEGFYRGYRYIGVDIKENQPIYRRIDYKVE